MPINIDDLEKWFQDRPIWLQEASRRLINNGVLEDKDYTEITGLCLDQANGKTVNSKGVTKTDLGKQDITKTVRLEAISNIKGINALRPTKPLEFGKTQLCIVYGRNGAGKSGYVRLLKHVCGSQRAGNLLPDIFKTSTISQIADITYTEETDTKTLQWSTHPIQELRGIDVYDTANGLVYVDEENEVTFEPWLLRLFTHLTNACEEVSKRIQSLIAAKISSKPLLPIEYSTTKGATWYNNINANTTNHDLDSYSSWNPSLQLELQQLVERLAEANPLTKAVILRRQKNESLGLMNELKNFYDMLTDVQLQNLIDAKNDVKNKQTALRTDADKVFGKSPLPGIGSDTWRILWETARKYSEEYAYKKYSFPYTENDACCVLCNQILDDDAQIRLQSFESFVKGELQNLLNNAEIKFANLKKALPLPINNLISRIEATGINDDNIRTSVIDFNTALTSRNQKILLIDKLEELTLLPPVDVLTKLQKYSTDLEAQATICDTDAKGQNRNQLDQQRKELLCRQWLNQQQTAIKNEITRLSEVQNLNTAKDLTKTNALSIKKSSLSEELITIAYVKRFKDELKKLGAERISVELKKTKTTVGHVYHRIFLSNTMKNVRTSEILSEGEFRIVSLAAFLADTEGRGAKTTFIFDDPISSLDHVYEEATAQRLIDLCKLRQVIVFTHRLSLVGYLEKYSDKQKMEAKLIGLSSHTTGEVTDIPIDVKRTDKALNKLINDNLSALKREQKNEVVYESIIKSTCHDIRVLLERIVEIDLLNGIVRRFNPEVNTKNKIFSLSKITNEDCLLIDDFMTKYSKYEHSQSDETPIVFPLPEEIEEDLNKIKIFIEASTARNKNAA